MRILQMTPDLNYSDGRSYYVSKLVKHLRKQGHFVHVLTNGGDSLDRIGRDLTVLPFLKNKSSYLRSLNSIADLTKDLKIDIIHTHHRYLELLSNSLPRRKVMTVTTALSIVDRRYFVDYKSDRIIAVSRAVKNMLTEKFGVKERKISLIPNFVDSSEARNSPDKTIESEHFNDCTIVLSAGRFHKEKDQLTLLKAMKLLRNEKIGLILIGEGPEEEALKEFARRFKLSVTFLPVQQDLTPYIQRADICALSSVRDPLPSFMLQSGLHGKPFIGSETDGIPEVIVHQKNGLLFPGRDEVSLANALMYLSRDTSSAEHLGKELKRTVQNNFTEHSVLPKIVRVYEELMKVT